MVKERIFVSLKHLIVSESKKMLKIKNDRSMSHKDTEPPEGAPTSQVQDKWHSKKIRITVDYCK